VNATRAQVIDRLRETAESMTVQALATTLAMHPNTVRFHLHHLVEDGLAEQSVGRADGRGRPALHFRATAAMDPAGPRHYRLLAEVLVESLAGRRGSRVHATRAGREVGRRLAAGETTKGTPIGRLHALLDEFGFAPQTDGDSDIRLRHCPFLELASSRDRIVCAAHLGLMQGALAAFGSHTTVERLDPFVEPDLCIARLNDEDTSG